MMTKKEYTLEVAGRTLSATFTNLADQAAGSVIIRYGETVVLATAVMGPGREGLDYLPLTVDYEEKFYAAGRILGSRFIKREGRPSDEAVLSGRIIDRTIRPLFNQSLRREVQVVATVLSIDETNDPDVPAVIGASLALGVSNIPWDGPVGAVRLGIKDDELKINPAYAERIDAALDLLVCGKDGKINMIEAEASEMAEDKLASAFAQAVTEIKKIEDWQKQIIADIGQEKLPTEKTELAEEVKKLFAENIESKLDSAVFSNTASKDSIYALKDEWKNLLDEKLPDERLGPALDYFETKVDETLHVGGLAGKRADGRAMDQLREIYSQAGGLSEIVHGSGIFYRGGTHILSVLTLSGPKDSQLLEGMEVSGKKHFMHHYNFPPFSVGETGRLGGMNRRAIGHGALAEKSLRAIIPNREAFPYTIRLVSETMASNGSSSMGSVCGSTLALMDGGVPIKAPVAGIAMGLIMDEKDEANYQILTDIQGPEDHFGDMDFKVAGTGEGVTGIQLDIKVGGIPVKVLTEALTQARAARLQIIAKIKEAIAAPRAEIKPSAPKIIVVKIPVEKIGLIIGPGGKTIHKISEETGAEIEIEEDGSVYVTGQVAGATAAKQIIEEMVHVYQPGERYDGEVTRLMDFGAFVKIGRDTEGLVHISELAPFRVDRVTDVVREGDKVPVVVKEVDEKGRLNLSLKAADQEYAGRKGATPSTLPAGRQGNPPPPPRDHGPRNGNGRGPRPPRY
jgi:polyribonucleotide nucleotidyltransferase